MTEHAANMLKRSERLILKDPGLRSVFINKKTGKVWRQGDIYTHPKLGKTLQRIADNGADEFYTGEVAKNLINDITKDGGIITSDDLANYKAELQQIFFKDFGIFFIESIMEGEGHLILDS